MMQHPMGNVRQADPVAMLDTPAARFGNTDREETNKAYPFAYAFISPEDDDIEEVGFAVAPGATVRHPRKMDPDYPFFLHHIRYTAYRQPTLPVAGFSWYETGTFAYDYQRQIGMRYTQYLAVTVTIHNDGRHLYGGADLDPNSNNSTDPVEIEGIQGYDYGYGQIKTPYLIPQDSTVIIKVTSTHPDEIIFVNGMLYGVKVRI